MLLLRIGGALALLLVLSSCAQMKYYAHLAGGQREVMSKRESIAGIVGDERRDANLRRRLMTVQDARRYAVDALSLPDNASYTQYTDLGRPYVVWNVLSTTEFSLEPVQNCFLFVGCLAYRGYYDKAQAQEEVRRLRRKGLDADIGGVPAYSTLGWFDDPVLNTMMNWSDATLVGTLFHELAHQQLYIKDDTRFNESFASFVEQEGVKQYLRDRDMDGVEAVQQRRRDRQFVNLVLSARDRLKKLYSQPLATAEMRRRKQAEFERLREEHAKLRDKDWKGSSAYDGWFSRELNNALLLPFGLYDEWVPAFEIVFGESGGDWQTFYDKARSLGELDAPQREEKMNNLLLQALSASAGEHRDL